MPPLPPLATGRTTRLPLMASQASPVTQGRGPPRDSRWWSGRRRHHKASITTNNAVAASAAGAASMTMRRAKSASDQKRRENTPIRFQATTIPLFGPAPKAGPATCQSAQKGMAIDPSLQTRGHCKPRRGPPLLRGAWSGRGCELGASTDLSESFARTLDQLSETQTMQLAAY